MKGFKFSKKTVYLSTIAAAALLAACGGGSGSTASSDTTIPSAVAAAYPTSVAIASPTAVDEGTTPTAMVRPLTPLFAQGWQQWDRLLGRVADRVLPQAWAATIGSTAAFEASTERINDILGGSTTLSTAHFNPRRLLRTDTNANCYGPQLDIAAAAHPDNGAAAATTMPGGDLGIWSATEAGVGNACAVAQLNARMRGVSARSSQAMIALAMLVKRAYLSGSGLPAVAATVNVTSTMPAIPNVTWTTATIAQPTSGNYTYTLQFSFVDATSTTRYVDMSMSHAAGTSTSYSGLLTYAITGDNTGGNCPLTTTTLVGTLKYLRNSETDLNMSHRSGQYCGSGTTAGTLASDRGATFESDGQLNPSSTYNGGTQKGWADNFNRFGGSMNPNTRTGSYLYAWQAGFGDSHTRMLQMKLDAPSSGSRAGEAYFGYSNPINAMTGNMLGMICNWAGPGAAVHSPLDYVQRQGFTQASSTSMWVTEVTPNIRYAPANTCTYAGTTKWYDRDLDHAFTETDAQVQAATTDADFLMGKGASLTIAAAIAARGYTVPSMY